MQKGIEDSAEIMELLFLFEKVIVYILVSLVGITFMLDFIPDSMMKPNKKNRDIEIIK